MDLQFSLLPARIIELICFGLVISTVTKKFQKLPPTQRPLLNILFARGLVGWFIYTLMDILIFQIGAISFTGISDIELHGYNFNYPSLVAANIFRDIGLSAGFYNFWCFYFIPHTILYGEERTKHLIESWWRIAIYIGLTAITVLNDHVGIIKHSEFMNIYTNADGIFGAIIIFIPIAIYIITVWNFRKILKRYRNQITNPLDNRRIQLLIWGMLVMLFSYLWFFLNNMIAAAFGLFEVFWYLLIVSYVLHICWIVSPIIIYLGVRISGNQKAEKL
jgi:hypothetical protein